eukprot:2043408-Pyramimonas_sp.AAC.1
MLSSLLRSVIGVIPGEGAGEPPPRARLRRRRPLPRHGLQHAPRRLRHLRESDPAPRGAPLGGARVPRFAGGE